MFRKIKHGPKDDLLDWPILRHLSILRVCARALAFYYLCKYARSLNFDYDTRHSDTKLLLYS